MRLLLIPAKGCTSFNNLLTYNGVIYDRFKDIAYAIGLLSDDKEIIYALEEVAHYANPTKLWHTFALM